MRRETVPSKGVAETLVLRPELLGAVPGLVATHSTRVGGVSPAPFGLNLSFNVGDDPSFVEENRKRFFGRIGVSEDDVVFQRQVHGTTVRVVEEPGVEKSCDALVTQRRGRFLAVSIADCVPIFLCEPSSSTVAVVHAGWRGSADGIVTHALNVLSETGIDPSGLMAWIGPAAGSCCYEVGEEVASRFDRRFVDRSRDGRPHVDLKGVNAEALLLAGVPANALEVSPLCTICRPDILHSYRRDGTSSGRMLGVIGFRG